MGRNSGIFWGMLEMSLLVGNTFAYFQFKDTDDIGIYIAFAIFSSNEENVRLHATSNNVQ